MIKKLLSTALTISLMFCLYQPVSAQIIMSESFDYEAGQSLVGLNGGTGWGGAFTAEKTSENTVEIVSESLEYPALLSSGGALKIITSGNNRYFRKFSSELFTANSTIWVSYLLKPENTLGGSGQIWLQPYGGKEYKHEWSGFGWHWSGNIKSIGDGANQGDALVGGRTYLLVAKYEINDSEITASFWSNPYAGEEPSAEEAFTSYDLGAPGASDSLHLWAGYGSETVYIDEIKFGKTYLDVAPLGGTYDEYNISVLVNDESGNPIQGATVTVGEDTYTTDASGTTSVGTLIEGRSLSATAAYPGYYGGKASAYGDSDQTITIVLYPEETPTNNPKVVIYTPCHPDDELFGANISFAKYIKMLGHQGYFVFTTMGGYTYDASGTKTANNWEWTIRRDEGERSANFFGADARFMSCKDGSTNAGEIEERMCRMIRELQPDVLITHASNGEYGHNDHVNTTNGVSAAVEAAADPTKYPEQLEEGLSVWDTPKFYRQSANYNGWGSDESITLTVPGNVGPISELGDRTIREYAVYAMEHSHYHAIPVFGGFDWGNTYPVPNEHSLHLVRLAGGATVPDSEETMFDGLVDEHLQTYEFQKDWLILGPFDGDIHEDFTSGENNLKPSNGDTEGGLTWAQYAVPSYNLDTDHLIDNRGMENKSNIDLKESLGYIPSLVSDAVAYGYTKINVSKDTTLILGIMAHDYYKLWVNGKLVRMRDTCEEFMLWDIDDRVAVDLKSGDNDILIKVASRSPLKSSGGSGSNGVYDGIPYSNRSNPARAWSFAVKTDVLPESFNLSTVNFNVSDGSQSIEGADVRFNHNSALTNTSGAATFDKVFNRSRELSYAAYKEGYHPAMGMTTVDGDKSIDIIMNMIQYYNITFAVSDKNGNVEGANVSLGDSVRITDSYGEAIFSNMTNGTNVPISITKDGYKSWSSSTNIDSDKTIPVTLELLTSISDEFLNGFKLYPNPSNGMVTIEFDNIIDNNLEVYSTNGALVYSEKLSSEKATIDLSNLEAGVYFIRVSNSTKRLIIK